MRSWDFSISARRRPMPFPRRRAASGRTGSATGEKRAASGLDHRQHDDCDEEKPRHLVEYPVPALRAAVASVAQIADQPVAPEVVEDEAGHQHELHAQPMKCEISG